MPDGVIDKLRPARKASPSLKGDTIPRGRHDIELTRIAGKLREAGAEEESIHNSIVEVCEKRCEGYGNDYLQMCRKIARSVCKYAVGKPTTLTLNQSSVLVAPANPTALPDVDEQEIVIPPFDPTVMVGIVKDIVDLACEGTSMAPQFPFLAARTIIGALMTSHGVTFKDTDVDALMISTAIGSTGSSKGWAWKRVLRIFQLAAQQLCVIHGFGAKIVDGLDSGAGLKDFFFAPPEDQPVIAYIDEIADFGDKSQPTRNPGIVTSVLELADSRSVSRTLAGKKKHKPNAYFAMYACGQDGPTYMMSVPGKKKMGFFDRARPEYSEPAIADKTPDIDPHRAAALYNNLMSMIGAIQLLALDAEADQAIEISGTVNRKISRPRCASRNISRSTRLCRRSAVARRR